ncbi:terpene synthase family protein [Legionella israelensis]|uniref:Terpene synthase n=1 Tax=Legionella israelensis TaxID=454 RepID=A0A0W0V2J2_9GAMM|nr:hypothetical protein [Legionella israelensis]KTD14321.1 Germacrene A synthase [Legionella israelensis]QBS09753.1 hypothetical protein E4T55_07705 [Legionella israelensis]SCY43120.1 hypothetical protein SAMN02746069_02420 [Legionella israelensis DSM 19235]STX59293.1 Terpene synthase family, metal binding domain [Legionella israelensis]
MRKIAFFPKADHSTTNIHIQCLEIKVDFGWITGNFNHNEMSANIKGKALFPPHLPARNPHIEAAGEENIQWLLKMGLIQEKEEVQKARSSRFSALFSTPLREKSQADLKLVADFIAFLFIFDGVVDNWAVKNNFGPVLNKVLDVFYRILSGDYADISKIPENESFPRYQAFAKALFDIRDRLNVKIDAHSCGTEAFAGFLKKIKNYFDSLRWEEKVRSKRWAMSETDYITMREHTGAVWETFAFIALVMGVLEPEDPLSVRIIKAGVHALDVMNDLVSFQKELDEPDHPNMVWVMLNKNTYSPDKARKEDSNPLQQAIDETFIYHNQEVQSLLILPKYLSPERREAFEPYLKIVTECLYDNLYWSVYETPRYQEKANGTFLFSSESGSFKLNQSVQSQFEAHVSSHEADISLGNKSNSFS